MVLGPTTSEMGPFRGKYENQCERTNAQSGLFLLHLRL